MTGRPRYHGPALVHTPHQASRRTIVPATDPQRHGHHRDRVLVGFLNPPDGMDPRLPRRAVVGPFTAISSLLAVARDEVEDYFYVGIW